MLNHFPASLRLAYGNHELRTGGIPLHCSQISIHNFYSLDVWDNVLCFDNRHACFMYSCSPVPRVAYFCVISCRGVLNKISLMQWDLCMLRFFSLEYKIPHQYSRWLLLKDQCFLEKELLECTHPWHILFSGFSDLAIGTTNIQVIQTWSDDKFQVRIVIDFTTNYS